MKHIIAFLLSVLVLLITTTSTTVVMAGIPKVVVETIHPARDGSPQVTASSTYRAMVTLYIENADGSKTPSGWSTRVSDGADIDNPFAFQPGVGLIEGWTQGVLQMKEGERAWIHVPAALRLLAIEAWEVQEDPFIFQHRPIYSLILKLWYKIQLGWNCKNRRVWTRNTIDGI
jgi:hypothetical protein